MSRIGWSKRWGARRRAEWRGGGGPVSTARGEVSVRARQKLRRETTNQSKGGEKVLLSPLEVFLLGGSGNQDVVFSFLGVLARLEESLGHSRDSLVDLGAESGSRSREVKGALIGGLRGRRKRMSLGEELRRLETHVDNTFDLCFCLLD